MQYTHKSQYETLLLAEPMLLYYYPPFTHAMMKCTRDSLSYYAYSYKDQRVVKTTIYVLWSIYLFYQTIVMLRIKNRRQIPDFASMCL